MKSDRSALITPKISRGCVIKALAIARKQAVHTAYASGEGHIATAQSSSSGVFRGAK